MGSLEILAQRHKEAQERPFDRPAARVARAADAAPSVTLRVRSRIPTVDVATNGGFVRGATYLIHGAPGAGKSTLLAQCAGSIPQSVYVSAEESLDQMSSRFVRLGYSDQLCAAEHDIDAALEAIGSAPFAVVDSISRYDQMLKAADKVVRHAQRYRNAIALVCHETKRGRHAGPRKLEHLIDCSLALMIDHKGSRVLVTQKNRFGPAPVAYELTMTERGLV